MKWTLRVTLALGMGRKMAGSGGCRNKNADLPWEIGVWYGNEEDY